MIDEIQRDRFLSDPRQFADNPCLAVAAVAGRDTDEGDVLAGWASLRLDLNGSGARIGYHAFIALLRDGEADLRAVVTKFTEQKPEHASWRFVAAPIERSEQTLNTLQEVEWRAHKDIDVPVASPVRVIGVSGAL